MPTSELSDALNPYYAQPRSRPNHVSNTTQRLPLLRQPVAQQHIPPSEELELAIVEPVGQITSPTPPPLRGSQTNRAHVVQELLRFLSSTREAQEAENRRRAAWEARYALQQAEMERRLLDMQQEITSIKMSLALYQDSPSTGRPSASTSTSDVRSSLPASSTLDVLQQQTMPPAFAPSSIPPVSPVLGHPVADAIPAYSVPTSDSADISGSPSLFPAPFAPVHPSPQGHGHPKRKSATLSDSEREDNSDNSSTFPQQRLRRRNNHDNRCLTIQHAMRNHLLRVMQLDSDKQLPDSHVEGIPLALDEPVRFVWDKTPKQSVHNNRMKEQVLKDLKFNRRLYKHVPDKEFGKKSLEAAFDQAFITLRQKFKAQRDMSVAKSHKQREDTKAMRARRLSRRKIKLNNRSEARTKMPAFEHVAFDGALQLECMSSEESEVETDSTGELRTVVLRIRGYSWRSVRLQRFFNALDTQDRETNAQKPRRGVGRKERYRGPPKENVVLPPKGVATWMISKRWMAFVQVSHSEVLGMLKEVVVDPDGFDWNYLHPLGDESDDEGWVEMSSHTTNQTLHYRPPADSPITSSSLQNALTHVG